MQNDAVLRHHDEESGEASACFPQGSRQGSSLSFMFLYLLGFVLESGSGHRITKILIGYIAPTSMRNKQIWMTWNKSTYSNDLLDPNFKKFFNNISFNKVTFFCADCLILNVFRISDLTQSTSMSREDIRDLNV